MTVFHIFHFFLNLFLTMCKIYYSYLYSRRNRNYIFIHICLHCYDLLLEDYKFTLQVSHFILWSNQNLENASIFLTNVLLSRPNFIYEDFKEIAYIFAFWRFLYHVCRRFFYSFWRTYDVMFSFHFPWTDKLPKNLWQLI